MDEMALSPAQKSMLRDIADGDGPTDYANYADRAGSALGWRNRERVLSALLDRKLIDDDLQITDAGCEALNPSVSA